MAWRRLGRDRRARDRAFSCWLNNTDKIVLSSTLRETAWQRCRVVDEDPAVVVAELREQPGEDIIVLASSSVIRALLRAEATDELSITLRPELPGGGTRLFDGDFPESTWRLEHHALTDSGAVSLLYQRVGCN